MRLPDDEGKYPGRGWRCVCVRVTSWSPTCWATRAVKRYHQCSPASVASMAGNVLIQRIRLSTSLTRLVRRTLPTCCNVAKRCLLSSLFQSAATSLISFLHSFARLAALFCHSSREPVERYSNRLIALLALFAFSTSRKILC